VNISISSIAWDVELDASVAELMSNYGIHHVDLTPTRYFEDLYNIAETDVLKVKSWWNNQGINIYGMQSLLFGTNDLNIFDIAKQKDIFIYLDKVFYVASILGIKRLVFGSPRNRDRSALSDTETFDISTTFFYKIGEIANKYDLIVCLEPNPSIYGANFMTNHEEAAFIVKAVSHRSIGLQLDTGAIMINKENITNIIKNYLSLIKHIHLSEPMLHEIDKKNQQHSIISSEIKNFFPSQILTIEMLASNINSPLKSIKNSLEFVRSLYG